MKRIVSVILALAMSLSAVLLAVPQTAFADTSSDTGSIEFTAEKTDITCSSVYNRGGYGVVSFGGPYEGEENWTWYGLIDSSGNYVIPAKPMENDPRTNTFGNTFLVSDGIICDYKKGYYNPDGSEAFSMDFFDKIITAEDVGIEGAEVGETYYTVDAAFPFFKGTALVQLTAHATWSASGAGGSKSVTSPVYVIDTKGNVLQTIEDWTIRFYGGQGMVIESTGQPIYRRYDKTLVLDATGKGYRPFMGTGTFFEDRAWVISDESGLVGYIDTTGEEVIPCQYDVCNPFGGGLANVKKDGKYGYIDANNNVIIPFEYDGAYGACDGIAVVGNGGKYGFVDYDNNVVLPLEWDDLSTFENNVAYGIKDGELYVITKKDTGTDPYLATETFWQGMEYAHSPRIQNANPGDLEIKAVLAADPTVIEVKQVAGQGTSINDYVLIPHKAGTTNIRVEYLLNGKAGVMSAAYTVKPFPTFLTNLSIDGQAQAAETYTNNNYYDINSYKGTAPSLSFTVADGWRLEYAYGYRVDESGSSNIIIEADGAETAWTFEFPETSKSLYTFYYFKNDLDEEIMYSVRFYREDDQLNPPAPVTGWVKEDGYWYYFDEAGQKIFDSIENIGGKLYFFDADGKMLTGWIEDGSTWYYANTGGDLAIGWFQSGTTWYYMDLETGAMQTGFVTVGNAKYYMAPSGAMQTGWIKDNDNWYYTNASGAVQTGWVKVGNTWYYMDSEGIMQTGWVTIGGSKYYMAASGAMQTGWIKDNDNWYYTNASGAVQTGWVKVGNTWYYMDSEGIMQTGWVTIGSSKYYMNASGAMVTGWVKDGDTWYYMNASGAMVTGWVKVGNSWYYMKADGAMAAGEWVAGYYWIGGSGVWTYQPVGSWKSNSKGRWFGDTSGWYAKNETLKIDDVLYTFDADGYLVVEDTTVNR